MSNDNKVLPFKAVAKVTPEVTVAPPNQRLVAMLEGYLESAKAGKIIFMAIAMVDDKGVAQTSWEPETMDPMAITAGLGAIAFLSYRFSASVNEGAVEV